MKKVIFFMIDSLMPHVLDECIEKHLVPGLKFLIERGMYWDQCTTVFPTMTATVDCSLITGEYADIHKIPALIWYNPEEKRLVNYINGMLPVAKMGLYTCAHDVICSLNESHLSKNVQTIYEDLEKLGRTSGSINLIAHRSSQKYPVRLPFLLKLGTMFRPFEEVSGPDVFTLGRVAQSKLDPPLPWSWDETLIGHYGINDHFATRVLCHLIRHQLLPDFTMVYMPDNDHKVHRKPKEACRILRKVDDKIQKILNMFSSWEEAIEKHVFILTGDHGQTLIGQAKNHNIDLDDHLKGLKIADYAGTVKESDDLVIANNERMTNIYPLKPHVDTEVIYRLQQDPRIDLIAYKANEWVEVRSGEKRESIRFRPEGNSTDLYGRTWTLEGNADILDLDLATNGNSNKISFGDYPDVLSRLYGALFSQTCPIISCTAKPGYDFKSAYAPTHLGGGSHGSLHLTDSTVPLIIAGAGQEKPFKNPRLVDLKGYILGLLT